MKKNMMLAMTIVYLTVLAIWVVAFIGNLPGSRQNGPTVTEIATRTSIPVKSSDVSAAPSIIDYLSLMNGLSTLGKTVVPGNKRALSLLGGTGHVITVDGNEIQVFEYSDNAAANARSELISADGSTIDSRMISWSKPPHLFKKGKLIVLYVGNDLSTLNTLQKLFDTQFAGG